MRSLSSTSLVGEGPLVEPWVSVDDVAAHLGVRKDSVYRWIEHRGLPAQKIGKLWKLKLSEVETWMRSGGRLAPEGASHPASSPRAPLATILVVDDDESLRDTLADFLADAGYDTIVAADGAEALDILRRPSTPRPGLILLDLAMPVMDGCQFRQEQAKDPQLRSIPVIFVTADRRSDLGGFDVLLKPLHLGHLSEAIRRRLGKP